ncbi:MAG: glycosyltransferase family 4 protein [Bacteroidetes bacterium]|nr:glycosyltransferase family 4 protein [Bacteroidota bacterium]
MKLLILTQYFPPEVGAPQNRLFELAVRLKKAGVDVSVLTAMPNYPQMKIHEAYVGKSTCLKHWKEFLFIVVQYIFPKSKSIVQRLMNYFSFVYSSGRTGVNKIGDVDIIMCESPPLFLGWSALYLKRKKKAKLIFNVSDLWPESAEKLGVVTNKWMLKLAYNLEEKLYKRSALVSGQTQGICKNINQRFPEVPTYWLPNGVDISYYDPTAVNGNTWREKNNFNPQDVLFLYAGIIGLAQGLEVILHAAQLVKDKPELKFILLGSGPEKEKLQQLKAELQLENVLFVDGVTKKEMPEIVAASDVSVIPLKKMDLFLGAIPSKIFENLAMQKPILLGVDGEAKELFIEQGNCGLYFEPENYKALAEAAIKISTDTNLRKQLGENGRKYVSEKFNRDTIANSFYERIKLL